MVYKCLTHCLAFGQHTPISSSLGGVPTFTSFSVSQSLSPQDRAAYKEYISNVSVGAGWCWGKGGVWGSTVWNSWLLPSSVFPFSAET